jgi:hypothetical protein
MDDPYAKAGLTGTCISEVRKSTEEVQNRLDRSELVWKASEI